MAFQFSDHPQLLIFSLTHFLTHRCFYNTPGGRKYLTLEEKLANLTGGLFQIKLELQLSYSLSV